MTEGSWWGIKFVDKKFLRSLNSSPAIEVFMGSEGYMLKLSGQCEIEPGLSKWQLEELEFIGWKNSHNPHCECYVSLHSTEDDLVKAFNKALDALYFIYGISEDCRLVSSHDWVDEALLNLNGIKKVRGSTQFHFPRPRKRKSDRGK